MSESEYIIRPIEGICMLPLLCECGDSVRLTGVTASPELFDVVLFRRKNGRLILHRIVKRGRRSFYIMGDNCKIGEWVRKERIIAVAEGFFKDGTYISHDDGAYRDYIAERCKDIGHRKYISLYESERHIKAPFPSLIRYLTAISGHRAQKCSPKFSGRARAKVCLA